MCVCVCVCVCSSNAMSALPGDEHARRAILEANEARAATERQLAATLKKLREWHKHNIPHTINAHHHCHLTTRSFAPLCGHAPSITFHVLCTSCIFQHVFPFCTSICMGVCVCVCVHPVPRLSHSLPPSCLLLWPYCHSNTACLRGMCMLQTLVCS